MSQLSNDLSHAVHCATLAPMQLPDMTPPEEQLARAMIDANIDISNPPYIVFDGKMHRFPVDTDKRGKKSGWYVAFGGDIPAWNFGNWKLHSDGEGINGHVTVNREWTDIERENYRKQQELIKQKKAAEREKRAKLAIAARSQALEIWNAATPATSAHEYIAKKKIQAYDLRVTTAKIQRLDGGKDLNLKNALIIPYSDDKGITTLQFITPTGDKFFLPCGSLDNAGYLFKHTNNQKRVYVVEGWATGASVHEATGNDVIVAINAGGLKRLAPNIRASYDATTEIVFVADNDDPAKGATQGAGEIAACEAAVTIGAKVILIPRINGDKADANDYAAFYGVDKLRELLTPSEQTSVSNNPAAMAGDYSGFAFNMDGKGSVTPISSPLPAIGASSAAMPTEIPVTQNILAASPAMPQTPITASTPASAANQQTTEQKKRWMHSAVDYRNKVQRPRWLVKQVAKRGELHMIYGAPGCGKSFVMLSLAMTVACKRKKEWFGQAVLGHGPVIYLAGEGFDGIVNRLDGAFQEEAKEGFDKTEFRNLYISEHGAKLDNESSFQELLEEINNCVADCDGLNPVLIIIDTLQNANSGDENSVQDMGRVIDKCKQLTRTYDECGVFIVHHKGKSKDSKGPRGSSAWEGSLNLSFFCQREEDQVIFEADTKHKDSSPIKEKHFTLAETPIDGVYDDDGEQISTCVLTWDGLSVAAQAKGPKLTAKQHRFLGLFCSMIEEKGFYDIVHNKPDVMCVSYDDFYEAFKTYRLRTGKTDTTEKAHNNAFNRAIESLSVDKGILECEGTHSDRVIRFTEKFLGTDQGTYYDMAARERYRDRRTKIESGAAAVNIGSGAFDSLRDYYKAQGRYNDSNKVDSTSNEATLPNFEL